MKRILFLCSVLLISQLSGLAKNVENIYLIKDITPTKTTKIIYDSLINKSENIRFDAQNNIIFSDDGRCYFRIYKSDLNSEIYMITASNDKEFYENNIKNIPQKTFLLNDKASLKKYKTEYLTFAKENNFKNIKNPQKTNSQGYIKYNPYSGNIRNKEIETLTKSLDNIEIKRTQLKPKCKVKHYANEYVYEIINNTDNDIIINKVASDEFIGLTQIAAYCMIPRGMDFIPIWGIIYGIQTDLEKNKFTRPHPINETIKKKSTMKILALSQKADNPTVDFYFTINNTPIKFTFNPNYGENF